MFGARRSQPIGYYFVNQRPNRRYVRAAFRRPGRSPRGNRRTSTDRSPAARRPGNTIPPHYGFRAYHSIMERRKRAANGSDGVATEDTRLGVRGGLTILGALSRKSLTESCQTCRVHRSEKTVPGGSVSCGGNQGVRSWSEPAESRPQPGLAAPQVRHMLGQSSAQKSAQANEVSSGSPAALVRRAQTACGAALLQPLIGLLLLLGRNQGLASIAALPDARLGDELRPAAAALLRHGFFERKNPRFLR